MTADESVRTDVGEVAVRVHTATTVHRVGYSPTPWKWTDWVYAEDGRFDGRWDDPGGSWRTLYVAESRLACLLELLARFRPSTSVAEEIAQIEVDDEEFPTAAAGTIPVDWCTPRRSGTATLSGTYALPGHHRSLAGLRRQFRTKALVLGLDDLDAAAIRDARPRALTRGISAWLYQVGDDQVPRLDGIEFASRHGDDLTLWAIYERGGDAEVSPRLRVRSEDTAINPDDSDLAYAMELLGLTWAD